MGVTFYFVRHAETYLNAYERMQGWSNAPLTPKGIDDCHASGRGLKNVKFDAVYTSDLSRTIETAEIMLSENMATSDVVITPKKAFREVFFGEFEGLPVVDIWPQVIEKAGTDGMDKQSLINTMHELDSSKHSEDYMTFWLRIEEGLLELLQKYSKTDKTILVVSHGLALNIMLSGIIHDYNFDGRLDNASVTKVCYRNGQFELEYINKTDHFEYNA